MLLVDVTSARTHARTRSCTRARTAHAHWNCTRARARTTDTMQMRHWELQPYSSSQHRCCWEQLE